MYWFGHSSSLLFGVRYPYRSSIAHIRIFSNSIDYQLFFDHYVFSKSQKITEKTEHNVTKLAPINYIDG